MHLPGINYTTAESAADLDGILALQRANLPGSISAEEARAEGFVTVAHTRRELHELNEIERHVIAKEGNTVVGYLLTMTTASRNLLPVLVPLFEQLESTFLQGRAITSSKYIVVGQVCIAKSYRGIGILDHCYAHYRDRYRGKYALAVTEIAVENKRSLRVHTRIGFQELATYSAGDGVAWVIVGWDWNAPAQASK